MSCADAAGAALDCRRVSAGDALDLFDTAVDLAGCVPLVGVDNAGPTPAERDERRGYADEAVTTLRLAVEAGFQDANRLRTARALDPLRSRPDFRRLEARAWDGAFPADPFRH